MPRLSDQDDGVEKPTPDILSLPADVFLLVTDAILEAETLDMNQGVGKGLTIYHHIKFFGKGEFWWQSSDQVELNWGAFDRWRDLARFGATCKTLYSMVTPILYRSDTKYNYSSALMISARKGVLSGVLRSLEYGKADPNMEDHTLFFHWARVHGVSQKLPPLKISRECILPSLTGLHLACFNDHPEIVDTLLNHQADINERAHAWCTRETGGPYRPYDQYGVFGVTKWEFLADKQTKSLMPLFGANALFFALKATQYSCDCSGCTKWASMEGPRGIKGDTITHNAKAVMKASHTWDIGTCDEEKPACSRCRRLKYVCPGYPDQWTLVLRQQDAHAKEHVRKRVERAQRRRAEAGGGQLQGRNTTSPPPAWTPFVGPETPSVYKFFTDYTSRSGIAYLTSLKDCYALQPASCLANAIHAAALASVARQRSEVGLMDRARLTYGKAIREVNRAIQDEVMTLQVIAAEFAPDPNPTSEPGCHPHARGALALLRYRAQYRLSNALDCTLLVIFQHLRLADLFTTSYMIPPLWSELEAFINSLGWGSLLDPLVRRAVDLKIRFMSATLGKASDSVTGIVRSGVLVTQDLQDAANSITFDPKFDGPPPAVFNALISISSATHAAVARCLYLTVRLHIFEIISKATSDSFDDMSVHLDHQQLLSMPAAAPSLVNELGKALGCDGGSTQDGPGVGMLVFSLLWPMTAMLQSNLVDEYSKGWVAWRLRELGAACGFGLAETIVSQMMPSVAQIESAT
ncbi:hypothetical protein CGCFRS4_v011569 [Colletotrichum fructicola]|nr:hypothetical protein CGCFRS4_v011569 [Colletotrichum fructicola]